MLGLNFVQLSHAIRQPSWTYTGEKGGVSQHLFERFMGLHFGCFGAIEWGLLFAAQQHRKSNYPASTQLSRVSMGWCFCWPLQRAAFNWWQSYSSTVTFMFNLSFAYLNEAHTGESGLPKAGQHISGSGLVWGGMFVFSQVVPMLLSQIPS